VRPISGGSNPYRGYATDATRAQRRLPAPVERTVSLRLVPRADAPVDSADVELSVRVLADGGSITVKRRTVADPDGTRRTIGIDALIR
jgi:hypothetical protein